MDKYTINLSVNNYGVPSVVHAVQGDTGRTLVCNITDMEIPSGATAKFFAEKPSGAGIYNNAAISGNTITVELTNQTLAEAGTVKAQLQIINGDDTVSTFRFNICVEKTCSGDFPKSENESTYLEGMLEDMQQSVNAAVDNAENATSAANSAASAANQAAQSAEDALDDINGAVQGTIINDNAPSNITVYSSQKTNSQIAAAKAELQVEIGDLDDLNTTEKNNVVGAINELSSNSYLLQGGISIPENADMDDYNEVGNYYCLNNYRAATLKNSPFSTAFTLKVEFGTGLSYPRQTFTQLSTGNKSVRFYDATLKTWNNYFYFSNDAAIFAGELINSGDDLNDYTTPGIYKSETSTQTATILNLPETIPSGFILLVFSASQISKTQLIFPTVSGAKMYYRGLNSQGWQPWMVYQGNTIS